LYEELQRRLAALPGVKSVGVGKNLSPIVELTPAGQEAPLEAIQAGAGVGAGDPFQAMRVPLLAGRAFSGEDLREGARGVIINETMARSFWPGETALGKTFTREDTWTDTVVQHEVIGVVADLRESRYDVSPPATFYRPVHELDPFLGRSPYLAIRTESEPASLIPAIRRELKVIEPAMNAPRIFVMRQVLEDSTQAQRTYLRFLIAFAVAGLALAALGIYGVLAHSVARRTREIGIRMALGAGRRQVLGLVMIEGGRLMVAGVAAGLLAAFWLLRLLSSQLFQVSPTEPAVFAAVVILLGIACGFACWLPARRAARVDPMEALRQE
jgi:predicted permease